MSTKKLQILGSIPKNAEDIGAVSYDTTQTLTDEQKNQARENIGAAPFSHIDDVVKHITDDERTVWNAKSGKAVAFTVILSTSGWSGKVQTVSDARFLMDGYAYSVTPDSSNFSAYGEAMIYADNVTTTGQMSFFCSEVPTTDLTVNILRMEVRA